MICPQCGLDNMTIIWKEGICYCDNCGCQSKDGETISIKGEYQDA